MCACVSGVETEPALGPATTAAADWLRQQVSQTEHRSVWAVGGELGKGREGGRERGEER